MRVDIQVLAVTSGRIAAAAIQMIAVVLLARWVGPESLGLVMAVVAFAVIPQVLSDLGLPTLIIRERAADPTNALVRDALGFLVLSLSLAGCVATGVLVTLALINPGEFAPLILLGPWMAIERLADIWNGILLADGKAMLEAMSVAGRRMLSLAIMLAMYLAGMNGVLAYASSMLIAAAAGLIWVVVLTRKSLPRRQGGQFRAIFDRSRPFWLNSIATHARNVDTMLVAILSSQVQAGFYAAAIRLTNPLRLVPTALSAVVLPSVARFGGRIGATLWRTIGVSMGVVSIGYGVLVLTIPTVVPLLLGGEYVGAVLPMQIVCVSLVLGGWVGVLAAIGQGRGRERAVGLVALATTVVAVVLITVGAIAGGAVWASVGFGAALCAQAVALLPVALRRKRELAESA